MEALQMRRLALVIAMVSLFAVALIVEHTASPRAAAQAARPAGTTFSGKAFRFNQDRCLPGLPA
jgi:hypothetical protein